MRAIASNFFDDEGWRYGVRFESDGSVAQHGWNGSTQRTRAKAHLVYLRESYPGDEFTLVRYREGSWWEVVDG